METEPFDPCDEIREASAYVRVWMEHQPAVKEESLSDWLLYEISRRLKYVHYYAFTRHQESRVTGADWEWWVLFPTQYLRMRVQAKKAFESKDNYPELLRSNAYGLQIDKLISDADAVNAIPLYAFFSSSQHGSMCRGDGGHPDGVYLAGAKSLYDRYINQPRSKISASDLIAQSNPFSCFVKLDCSHEFCKECISSCIRSRDNDTRLCKNCPLCRTNIHILE